MTADRAGLAWEVMGAFNEPATATFDAILAAAALDEMTARALRFWQRESVHNTKQFAASAVPAALEAVARAQADAVAATERGAAAWTERGQTAPAVGATTSLPAPGPTGPVSTDDLLELRRRAVAARLTHLG